MFKRIQFKLEYFFAFVRKNWLFIITGIVIGGLGFYFQDQIIKFTSHPIYTTKIIGVEGLYTQKNLPENITKLISHGLTAINPNNLKAELSPLVKKIDISSDQLEYVLTLNTSLSWHDGKKLEAKDLKISLEGVETSAPNPQTLNLKLKKIFSPLLPSLATPFLRTGLVGLGDYRVKKITFQEGYIKTLVLSPDKIFRFYSNENDLINGYKIGEVDEIETTNLPTDFADWNQTTISQKIQTDKKYLAIFINTDKINNKQTRQALAYATPKTADKNERALTPISPNSWAYNPNVKEYLFNASKAKTFFEKNKIESINLSIIDRRLLATAETIKTSWEKVLGLKVNLSIDSKLDTQNYDIALAYGGIPQDPDQYAFWHSTQTKTNLTHLNHPKIDKLLEEGRQTTSYQERKKIYADFQKYLLEECPAIFLSYPTIYTISRTR